MKPYIRNLFLVLLGFILVFLDVYYLSFVSIKGISVLSSFIMLITLVLLNKRDYLVLALSEIIFLTIFSSISTLSMLILYLGIPALLHYLRRNILPEPSLWAAIIYYFASSLAASLLLIVNLREFDLNALTIVGYFTLVNIIFGLVVYFFLQKFQNSPRNNKITL